MDYAQIAEQARGKMGPVCKACRVCDGRACGGGIPGPGAIGGGRVAIRNRDAWADYRLNLDTITSAEGPDCTVELFGRTLALPVLAGPVGDVRRHYGDLYSMSEYNEIVLEACAQAGTLAVIGDGLDPAIVAQGCELIGRLGGAGIPTIKPWGMDVVERKVRMALAAKPVAVAMDVDAAGLPFLKGQQPPAGTKSVAELREIRSMCGKTPFVVKGIMTPAGAEKAARAGADAIVVSNHGGRVLDGVPSTAEVLPGIVDAVGDDLTVLVDGGIRAGIDIFRALALGAKAVLLARPFVVCAYGAGRQGVRDYIAQLEGELGDAMRMCGAATLDDINEDMLFF